MNICNIRRTFEQKKERGWDKIYVLVDVHGTLVPSSFHSQVEFTPYCPEQMEVLEFFTNREDIEIILWTSSYPKEIQQFMHWLSDKGIFIDYVNENPDCRHTDYADFSRKPYFNILIDDKSGMDPEIDWLLIGKALEEATGEPVITWNDNNKQRLKEGVERIKKSLDDLVGLSKIVIGP